MPNWIGDFVMATPVLSDLRGKFPEARITAMCQGGLGTLLEHDEDIDELFVFGKPSGWEKKDERRDVVERLRQGKYDLGVLLTGSFSSAWRFIEGRVKNRLGFRKDGRRFLLNRSLPFPKDIEKKHLVITYKQLLEPLGIEMSETAPRLHLLDREREEAREILARHGVPSDATVVGINPGAAYGSAKCWLPERFRELIERLLEKENVWVVCFGDANTAPLVKEICGGLSERVINLAGGTTLRELVALIERCDTLLTNDSGPMHVASAVGTPVVALFGSTNPVKTGPYAGGTVIYKDVECSPCYQRTCPIDFRCMKRIETDEVFRAISDNIARGRGEH
jgi:lipopolysaccharide heptosyltransferase II